MEADPLYIRSMLERTKAPVRTVRVNLTAPFRLEACFVDLIPSPFFTEIGRYLKPL